MLANNEITNLIKALGVGIDEQYDINGIRYHRIIIMTDADVDGSHIRTLLLTFFFRHMKSLIDKGYLYIAQPPLYAMTVSKKRHYAYTDEEKDRLLAELAGKKALKEAADVISAESGETKVSGLSIQRYKGLGEMDADQLWETTMNPENRVLLQVTIEDAERADTIMSKLMGEEVELRKNFIQTHARFVKDLDI